MFSLTIGLNALNTCVVVIVEIIKCLPLVLSTTNVLATGFETLQFDLARTEPLPQAKKTKVLARPCNVWVSARNRCTAATQKPSKNKKITKFLKQIRTELHGRRGQKNGKQNRQKTRIAHGTATKTSYRNIMPPAVSGQRIRTARLRDDVDKTCKFACAIRSNPRGTATI